MPDATALKTSLQQLAVAAAERAAAQSAEPGDGGTVSMQLPVISETGLIDVSPELAEIFAGERRWRLKPDRSLSRKPNLSPKLK